MCNLVRSIIFSTTLMLLFFSAGDAAAAVDEALQTKGWNEFLFDGLQANRFTARDDGGIGVISQGGVSLLKMPVSIDIDTLPALQWRWCVTEAAPATSLSIKGADDRSLAIYVAFPFIAEEASAFERIERKIVEATVGKDAPGRILMYVWGGEENRGTLIESPHLGNSGMMKVLRPAESPKNQWFQETINIADDYQAFFGTYPPNPSFIAISADTDDTNSASRGIVTDIEFFGPTKAF